MRLFEPHPTFPSEPHIWRALADNAQLLFNQALNTPVSWRLQSTDVSIGPGMAEIMLIADNFGKDVLAHTIDLSDPNHVERPLRRLSMQSSLLGGADPYAAGGEISANGARHTVNTLVFYRKDGVPYIKPLPLQQEQSAEYRIWYESAEPELVSEGSELILPQGVPLLCLMATRAVLPVARWCGYSDAQNMEMRKSIALSLQPEIELHDREWRKLIATDRQAGPVIIRGFDDSAYEW